MVLSSVSEVKHATWSKTPSRTPLRAVSSMSLAILAGAKVLSVARRYATKLETWG